MKISAALTLFSVAYVACAAKTVVKSTQLMNAAVAAVPGAGTRVAGLPDLPVAPVVTNGLDTVTASVSSQTNHVGTSTVNHGIATEQRFGTGIYPGFPDDVYNPYVRDVYPGYGRVYPDSHGGAHHSYFRWAYPGLSAGVYPGVFQETRHGVFRGLYPGLLEAAHDGVFGGAYSRYQSGAYPGLFGGAYRSLYGPEFFGYGASERVRTHFAGFQEGVSATVDPLSGLPVLIPVKVANRVVTIERLVPFPFPYPVPFPEPYPAQIPDVNPSVTKPGSVTTSVGTTSVSQGGVVGPVLDGSPVVTTADHTVGQTQTRLIA